MLCAVYLDPRVRFLLTATEIKIAKMKLFELYERIEAHGDDFVETNDTVEVDSFEELMKAAVYGPEGEQVETKKMERGEFLLLLQAFESKFPSISHTSNIHAFWE